LIRPGWTTGENSLEPKWLREVYRPLKDEINEVFRKLYNEKFGGFFMFLVNNYIKKIKSIHRPETL
jgi:hypothetical protein